MNNILVVDDTPDNLRLLVSILAEQGYDVRPASDGEFALQSARATPPDLILLDIKMPGMDGYAVCQHLKADDRTRDIPVIFISALDEVTDKVKGFALGGVDYITKPFQAEEVFARVHTHLALQRLRKGLEEKNAALEMMNTELNDFAYIVSHDLKAPLRSITQLANWLVQDYAEAFDEKGKEVVALLIGRVQHMDNLIGGILQYSRVGRLAKKTERIDLNTLVQEVIEMIAPPDHIHVVLNHNLPVVVGDQIRLQQVFQNLVGNAVKYMDKPEGQITIGCVDQGSYWTFSVADNGPGIDQKDYARIFQIFQTLNPRAERESTGIGLAIVKKIVEFYGGNVWVESAVGQGSTFFFTFFKESKQ
jgi:two-component system sensor histidine kinase/response regulator